MTIDPVDSELTSMHETEVHVFSDSVIYMGKSTQGIRKENRWRTNSIQIPH